MSDNKSVASISMKNLGFTAKEIRKLVEGKGAEKVFLCRIGGVAIQEFSGQSKTGEWHGLKGIFTLVTNEGEVISSSVAFLPNNITMKVIEQLKDGVIEVSFYTDIFAVESDKNASGYAFMAEPVMSKEAIEKAQTIADNVISSMSNQKKLAAPKKKSA